MKLKLIFVTLASTLTITTARTAELAGPTADATPAADDAAELAKKLSNPVAALISVPFQNNFDFGGGPKDDGFLGRSVVPEMNRNCPVGLKSNYTRT